MRFMRPAEAYIWQMCIRDSLYTPDIFAIELTVNGEKKNAVLRDCLLYTSPLLGLSCKYLSSLSTPSKRRKCRFEMCIRDSPCSHHGVSPSAYSPRWWCVGSDIALRPHPGMQQCLSIIAGDWDSPWRKRKPGPVWHRGVIRQDLKMCIRDSFHPITSLSSKLLPIRRKSRHFLKWSFCPVSYTHLVDFALLDDKGRPRQDVAGNDIGAKEALANGGKKKNKSPFPRKMKRGKR